MARPPPFSSLPYEIVSQICQQPSLDKDDLAALRLTYKSYGIHNAATASLGKHFEDITVLFSEHSFQTLVNICKHPVFSRYVRSVKLSSIRCAKSERLDNIVQALQREDSLSIGSAELEARSKHLNNLSLRIRSYVSRTQNEDEFGHSPKPLTLLTQAFQLLAQTGGRVAPGIAVREANSLGCGKVMHVKNSFSCLWLDESYKTLKLLTNAVLKANLTFTKFKIDVIVAEHPSAPWTSQRTIKSATVDMFSHAEALDLNLFCYRGFDMDQEVVQFLQNDIPESIQIKTLRLVGINTLERPPPISTNRVLRLCNSIPLLSLESLSLSGIEITIPELQAGLAKVQGTLRHLSIASCELNTTSWIPAIEYIMQHLTALDELHIAQNTADLDIFLLMVLMDEYERQKMKHEERLLARLDCYGQSNIQASLAEVLVSCENFAPAPSSAEVEYGDW